MRFGRIAALAAGLLIFAAGAFEFLSIARRTAAIDFYQMWVGARMARETRGFYDPATGARMGETYRREAVAAHATPRHTAAATYRRNLEMFSTPFLYALYSPLRGPYERDLAIFHFMLFAALVASIAIFGRLFHWPLAATLLFLGASMLAFEPVRSDFNVGNSNAIILAIVACSALLTSRGRIASGGAVLAIATVAKPHIALVFPILYLFWIAGRRWRELARHAAGAAIATTAAITIGSIYFRSAAIWMEWIRALRALPDDIVPIDIGNFSLVLIIDELTGRNASAAIAIVVAALLAFIAWRRRAARPGDLAIVAIGCVAALLLSRLVWLHYFTLAIPLVMWLMRPAEGKPAVRRQIAGGAALLLMAVRPWDMFIPTAIQVAALVNVGLLIAFAAALRELSLLREDRVQPDEHRQ